MKDLSYLRGISIMLAYIVYIDFSVGSSAITLCS